MSESETLTKGQLQYRRSKGVNLAWDRERELVRNGRGTRAWTVSEQKQLLKTGRVKGYQGHHMKSVAKHPEYAADPKNIQFLDARKGNNEHLKAHKGDYRNESDGRYNIKSDKIRPMNEGKPRAMNSYELKDKAIEKRGYTKYAAKTGSEKSAVQNKTSTKKNTGGKVQTSYKGETYKRTMTESPSKGKNSKVKSSSSKAKTNSSPQKSRTGSTQKYGAKTGSPAKTSVKKSSGYGSKVKSSTSTSSSGAKKSSSYGQRASGKSKSSSSGGQTRSSSGHGKSSGGQRR